MGRWVTLTPLEHLNSPSAHGVGGQPAERVSSLPSRQSRNPLHFSSEGMQWPLSQRYVSLGHAIESGNSKLETKILSKTVKRVKVNLKTRNEENQHRKSTYCQLQN